MMSIGKKSVLAIIESALFVIGAGFFLVVLIDPVTPLWALITGLAFAGAGLLIWIALTIFRHNKTTRLQRIEKMNETMLGKEDKEDDETYELHRPTSYDDPTLNPDEY